MIRGTVLPFKLEITSDLITTHSDLVLSTEPAVGLGVNKAASRYLSGTDSGAGYLTSEYLFLFILKVNGGGWPLILRPIETGHYEAVGARLWK